AVYWLQQHRIALFQAWFFNPANTFSPLAGSMFAAYLMAPMGNDSLARFMQIGPWVLIFLAVGDLGRGAGASAPAAALAGFAAAVSRPFISQAVLVKDDLFVTAFFLVALGALTTRRSSVRSSSLATRGSEQIGCKQNREILAPLRAGIALGL